VIQNAITPSINAEVWRQWLAFTGGPSAPKLFFNLGGHFLDRLWPAGRIHTGCSTEGRVICPRPMERAIRSLIEGWLIAFDGNDSDDQRYDPWRRPGFQQVLLRNSLRRLWTQSGAVQSDNPVRRQRARGFRTRRPRRECSPEGCDVPRTNGRGRTPEQPEFRTGGMIIHSGEFFGTSSREFAKTCPFRSDESDEAGQLSEMTRAADWRFLERCRRQLPSREVRRSGA